jgi:hypothetical protein
LRRTVERSIVKAGEEKKIAVASPSGRLRTAYQKTGIASGRIPSKQYLF